MISPDIQTSVDWNGSAVIRRTNRQIEDALHRTGARVRGFLLSKIKRKASSSSPGEYPHAHAHRNTGLRLIKFAVHQAARAVAIGPTKYGKTGTFIRNKPGIRLMSIIPVGKTTPQNTNEGGVSRIRVVWNSNQITNSKARHKRRPFTRLARPTAVKILLSSLAGRNRVSA